MSSVKSLQLTPADASDALQTALIEVSENSCFVFVEPCDAGQWASFMASAGAAPAAQWLKTSVNYTGALTGSVEIVLPRKLASWLVTSLLGMQSEDELSEANMLDGIGEFTNMVCGAWLSNLSDMALFELRVPVVTPMTPGWTPLAEPPGGDSDESRMVSLNDMPMRVRVRLRS